MYYAKQFDALRRRCGIDAVFLHSLARSQNWLAEGGKSKSNFWKTTDERFIIKTLVNAWNVADLYVPYHVCGAPCNGSLTGCDLKACINRARAFVFPVHGCDDEQANCAG